MSAMFEGDYRYNHLLGNSISADYISRSQQLEQKYLSKLENITYENLGADDRLSYDIYKYYREVKLEKFRDGHARIDSLMPVTQFFSLPTFLAQLGGGTSAQPFATVKDYENWLQRIGEFPAWVDQAIANFRQGIKENIVLPRVLVQRTLPQLAAHIIDDVQTSVFYQPLQRFPDEFTANDRKKLTVAYEKSIQEIIVPAYHKLHDFLAEEYLPSARVSVGIGHLPGGQAWYAYLARFHTTTTMTPNKIHNMGKQQAEVILEEMKAIKTEVGFDGDMQAFFHYLSKDPQFFHHTKDTLLDSYRTLKSEIDKQLSQLFDLHPRAEYVIRPIEAFREVSSATAEYLPPAPDGSRPGIFYVNTYELESRPIWEREALFLHEAVPGHHFQITIAMEQEHLPKFQRFDGPTSYVEGWGLYAETLGKELGLYTDPYQRMGALTMQIWRANRLVVDTGMHALGWTREQAIEWMRSNSPKPETDIIAEVERYLAISGQALAYKIGQTRISLLRQRAEQALAEQFDIKAFHRQLLADGAMPLSLLERKIQRWVSNIKSR